MNPYDWKRQAPEVEVWRPEVSPVAAGLRHGNSAVLLAGRGMGKSVFLQQLQRELGKSDDVRAILFEEPPSEMSVRAFLDQLARRLGVEASDAVRARDVIELYLEQDVAPHLVLLFDEFDRYARASNGVQTDPPGRDFFNSLESMRRSIKNVGILAAGGVGVFIFRDVLGSSFLARADKVRIPPFTAADIETLAQPFADRGRPLTPAVLAALHLASGGNPALVTYGLESLWPGASPTEHEVAQAFAEFQDRNSEFLRDVQLSFADPRLSAAPERVWELIRRSDGAVSRADLERASGPPDQLLRLSFTDVLELLAAGGLVRVSGSVRADPVAVEPITSLLSLPSRPSAESQTRERLRQDLTKLLAHLHRSSADFFRLGAQGKQLVPESVFSAFLGLGFELVGWRAGREVQQGAGRTDLRLTWSDAPSVVVVEVKIWGRNDYREAHRQVESYWSADTVAAAVVMLTDTEVTDWADAYRRECLTDIDVEPLAIDAPIEGGFCARSCAGVTGVDVDHFLLRLPRRR